MDYTNYDYQSLVDELTTRMADTEGWGEGYQSSTGQMLIQLFADSTDALMYMLERRSQEAFISTALMETSIFAHASELGYRPRRTICNTGIVRLTIDRPAFRDVEIPKYTKVLYNNGEYEFVTTANAVIRAGNTFTDIPIKEGTLVTTQYSEDIGNLTSYGDIVIENYLTIDQYSLEVDDSGNRYYDVEESDEEAYNYGSLAYASGDDPVYDIKYAIEGMRIAFGDDTFGKKPEGVITVRYIRTNGMKLPVLDTGIDFTFVTDVVYDNDPIVPKREYSYTLQNPSPITGYSDYESVTSIARLAPEFARANSRAITKSDYEFWGIRSGIGGIVDVSAFGEEESGSLIFNMNNVNLSYITETETPLDTEQEIQFRTYMNRYKPITTHLVIQEADKIEAVLTIKLRKETTTPMTTEEAYIAVRKAVDSYFTVKKGSIGNNLQHSEFVQYLQNQTVNVNGVTYGLTDYVKVKIQPQYMLPTPFPVYNTRVMISSSYTPVDGDVFSVSIDDTEFTVNITSGMTITDILNTMKSTIDSSGGHLLTLVAEDGSGVDYLRIQSKYTDSTFTLDLSGGTISSHVTSNVKVKIPSSRIHNTTTNDLIVRGSVTIVDSNQNVVFYDDGDGTLIRSGGGRGIGIDYRRSELLDPYVPDENETYYFRFQQDEFQNIQSSKSSIIVLSKFAELISDPDKYSTIEIL